jgi:hypothetical protein
LLACSFLPFPIPPPQPISAALPIPPPQPISAADQQLSCCIYGIQLLAKEGEREIKGAPLVFHSGTGIEFI